MGGVFVHEACIRHVVHPTSAGSPTFFLLSAVVRACVRAHVCVQATDAAGNSAVCNITVEVTDDEVCERAELKMCALENGQACAQGVRVPLL